MLTFDSQGDLYGTTESGGIEYFEGTVFKLSHPRSHGGTWTEKVLYEFHDGDDGTYPTYALVWDHQGNLYGTAIQGGAYDAGVVFKLIRGTGGSWLEATIHSFVGVNGGRNAVKPRLCRSVCRSLSCLLCKESR